MGWALKSQVVKLFPCGEFVRGLSTCSGSPHLSALHLVGAPERCGGAVVLLEGCHGPHRTQQYWACTGRAGSVRLRRCPPEGEAVSTPALGAQRPLDKGRHRALAENKISLDLGAPHLGSGVNGSRNCLAGTSCLVAGVSASDLRGHLSRPETGGSGGAQGTKILIPSPQGLESKEQGHVFKFF